MTPQTRPPSKPTNRHPIEIPSSFAPRHAQHNLCCFGANIWPTSANILTEF